MQQNMFQGQILPYTFTTGELDQIKQKLQSADNQMTQSKQMSAMLSMSISEIRTLLRMIDMTYLQGLSSSNQNVLPAISTPDIPQHMQQNGQRGGSDNGNFNQQNNRGMGGQSNGSMNNNSGRQPPSNYVCFKCGIRGHFFNECPTNGGQNNGGQQQGGQRNNKQYNQGKQPPQNYVCHKCQIPGHWINECPNSSGGSQTNAPTQQKKMDYSQPPPPNYTCHRCGVPGHWIKNCPTNNDPKYDNQYGGNNNSFGGMMNSNQTQQSNQANNQDNNNANNANNTGTKKILSRN